MKHTKHEWQIQKVKTVAGYRFAINAPISGDGPSIFIAMTAMGDPEDEANARLMSAAPKMLEFVERILHAHEKMGCSCNSQIGYECVNCNAKSIIAKTKGVPPTDHSVSAPSEVPEDVR